MEYESIKYVTLEVYKYCNVHSFPVDCHNIINQYNISLHPYSQLSEDIKNQCLMFSNDAINYFDKICYNDELQNGRINFSLMHELGHVLLNHGDCHTPNMEQEANYFSSNLLAPRMAIHYAKCKNENDVSKIFGLTNEAARYAFDDYRRWHRWTVNHKMNAFDKLLYSHFYNNDLNCFVYNMKECPYCESLIYNSSETLCNKCKKSYSYRISNNHYDVDFQIAESQWLYKFN